MFSQILDYIKKCKDLNIDDSTIFLVLKGAGWKEDDINYAFSEYNKVTQLPPPPIPNYDAPIHKIDNTPRAFYTPPVYTIGEEPGIVEVDSAPVVAPVFVQEKIFPKKESLKTRLTEFFKRKKQVDGPIVTVVPMDNPKPIKKKGSIRKKIAQVEKVLGILIAVGLLGFVIWWVISLNNKSSNFDALSDNARLAQINKIQDAVSKYYVKNKKLPPTLNAIDSKKEFIIDTGTGQPFDYKILTVTSFQTCTIFYANGATYNKGNVCFPFDISSDGGLVAGVAFNPKTEIITDQTHADENSVPFYNCKNPQGLLEANALCTDASGNCRKPMITQEFGMSTVGLSNSKDKIAQTFVLPKSGAKQLTEVAPYIVSYYGNMGCMSIYEQSIVSQPQSGVLLAEYAIDLTTLKKEEYNSFYINPITLDPKKSYSVVFSLLDNDSFVSFAKGQELSSYYDGNAYYLKRPLEECTAKDCPIIEWIDRQDDIKFKLKFF